MSQNAINEASAIDIATGKADTQALITEHLDLWTSAITRKSTTGRGSSQKYELYGIKKLRELILELAVRGKLVAQDPDDEPASDLLKRIEEEKAHLCKEGKISKSKRFPEITEEEKPFSVPVNWSYIRLGELTSKLGSGSTPRGGKSAYVDSGIPFLRSQNVWSQGLRLDDIAYISLETHGKMENTRVFPGDILLNITGASLGRSTIFPDFLREANVSQHVTIIRLIEPEMARFVHLGILSPMIQHLVWGRQVGMAIEGLSKKVLENFEFPIPPLAEQHRIVAKVDELMALCDQLENQTEQSLDAHATLVDTLLDALTRAQSAEELAENWQRLEKNWDILLPDTLAGERAIDKLKQTILQLAVMGKLAPQDPSDEPASKLLKRISVEKEQLIKGKKNRKQKPLPPITEEEKPFELPVGWEWCRLGELGIGSTGKTPSTKVLSYFEGDIPFVGPGQITPVGELLEPDKYLSQEGILQSAEAKPGDILMVCIGGSIGKSALCNRRMAFNQQINTISPIIVNSSFLHIVVSTKLFFQSMLEYSTGSATPIINRSKWEELPIPIGPLNEQHRIVAKVDELMALCELFKGSIKRAQKTQQEFTDAILKTALTGTIPEPSLSNS